MLIFLLLLAGAGAAPAADSGPAMKNREPLAPLHFRPLPLTAVKPRGWLRRQLQIQADGQTGHLDEFWPSLKQAESGWLGGSGESWERGPYYMDGLVPLAFLLDDPKLIAKATKWVSWTLEHQRPDGAIGPAKNTDWWPNMVMLKVLAQYAEATGDDRVVPLMQRYALYHLANAKQQPLKEWAIMRWGDEALTLAWLYNRTGDKRLLELASVLHQQGYDWKKHFENFEWTRKLSKPETSLRTHVVNNAMALKTSAVWSLFTRGPEDRKAIYRLLEVMDQHHLLPGGVHAGDEHYAGTSPVQGTELCAVVEAMFSLENLIAILGDPAFGDRLEKIAFNALPATFDKTMWSHQYDQQPNQVLCSVHPRSWTTNGPDSNLFGLEPNFGCCTANFHQGWPKYVASMWMATDDDGLAAVAFGPGEVNALVRGGTRVRIEEETDYPFRGKIRMLVMPESAVEFPLIVRIPAWAAGARVLVNGQTQQVRPGTFHRIDRKWSRNDTVELQFPMELRSSRWFNNSAAIERGPLVFSLRVGEDWRKLRDKSPAADWEVHPSTPWNYALDLNLKAMRVEERPLADYPFSPDGAPVTIRARGRRLAGWRMENGSAAPPPASPVSSPERPEEITLIPYGAAKLRITAFPVLAGR
jgi:hypothetical protein